jgi:hypothetical protein
MKIYFYLGDRQCGKTTMAAYEMSKPCDSLLVARRFESANHIADQIQRQYDTIVNKASPQSECLRGRMYDKIVLDEFFFMKNYEKIWQVILPMMKENSEIYIFSSYADVKKDWKWLSNIKDANIIYMTHNYRTVEVEAPVNGVKTKIKIPGIIWNEFIKEII